MDCTKTFNLCEIVPRDGGTEICPSERGILLVRVEKHLQQLRIEEAQFQRMEAIVRYLKLTDKEIQGFRKMFVNTENEDLRDEEIQALRDREERRNIEKELTHRMYAEIDTDWKLGHEAALERLGQAMFRGSPWRDKLRWWYLRKFLPERSQEQVWLLMTKKVAAEEIFQLRRRVAEQAQLIQFHRSRIAELEGQLGITGSHEA